jgi:benzylsuccinate CoA-transferase BbsE subunit
MNNIPPDSRQQPLSGFRVLELSGPPSVYCGKLMADMGADVIKAEPPGGDPMRHIGPFARNDPRPENSLYWLHFNTNKRGVTLDVTTPDGAQLFRRLVQKADVVLESFQPGFLESLGLGYENLSEINPGLVLVSITPFGQSGPYKNFKASDLIGMAMGGYLYVTGWPHTPPTRLWGSQAYHTASNRAFIAVLLALYHRMTNGIGQHIDVSMQEAVAATTEHVGISYIYEGKSSVRCGFRHGGLFVATWRCKDGYVSITTNTQQAWDDLRNWMAEESMEADLMDSKYGDRFVLRGEHSGHIEEVIKKWAQYHTREEITAWGQSHHHPFGPVTLPQELLQNPQLWDRGFFNKIDHPELGIEAIYPGAPFQMSRSPWKLRSTAPHVGQHNEEVYCQELGLSHDDLMFLLEAGAV